MKQDKSQAGAKGIDPHRNVLIRLIIRMSVYYLIVGSSGAALLHFFPQLLAIMPVGGLAEFGTDPFIDIENGPIVSVGSRLD